LGLHVIPFTLHNPPSSINYPLFPSPFYWSLFVLHNRDDFHSNYFQYIFLIVPRPPWYSSFVIKYFLTPTKGVVENDSQRFCLTTPPPGLLILNPPLFMIFTLILPREKRWLNEFKYKMAAAQTLDADRFQQLTPRTHIYTISDTYAGCSKQKLQKELLLVRDPETDKISIKELDISLPDAVKNIFDEALSNAADNQERARNMGLDPGIIEVGMSSDTIIIKNGGPAIPIEIHKETGILVPTMVFGRLLTSSNYDQSEEKTVVGKNGYGIKILGVFSTEMTVKVGDPKNKLSYVQTWYNNLHNETDPLVTPWDGEPFVEVAWKLDFPRFGYQDSYPDEAYQLFARYCADLSFTNHTTVVFNGHPFQYDTIEKYAELYFDDFSSSYLVHHEEHGKSKIEVFLSDTPYYSTVSSFVNGKRTKDGGVHVNAVYKAVSKPLIESLRKINEGHSHLNVSDLKPHLSLIVSARLINPGFGNQSKTELKEPTPKVSFSQEEIEIISKWNLVDNLINISKDKQSKALKKTDGKKSKRIDEKGGRDAHLAGGPRSSECQLFVIEGKSASSYATKAVHYFPEGHEFYGVFLLRGKPINAMNATLEQLAENKEIIALKEYLGLREGMDYTDPAARETLRYGGMIILADADVDGKHIAGLVLLYFYCRFPSLLQIGFVSMLRTPIIRIGEGVSQLKFYSMGEYVEYKKNGGRGDPKYFKGLGSSGDDEIKGDLTDPHYIQLITDCFSHDYFHLAFDSTMACHRKPWILKYQESPLLVSHGIMSANDFIDKEVIEHSVDNVRRSIPRLMDGLKESQRKALWGSYIRKEWHGKWGKDSCKTVKVGQFANFVAGEMAYHHGESILADTVAGMAQDFVGTNNLPYFSNKYSQLGTRAQNGKDASASRYTSTKPMWWLPHVYPEEDFPLMTFVTDEDAEREPHFMLPIIPMVVVNGCMGIGTGYSSLCFSHNPLDVINWLKTRITGGKPPALLPWYRGFRGKVYYRDGKKFSKIDALDRKLAKIFGQQEREPEPEPEPEPTLRIEDVIERDRMGQDNVFCSLHGKSLVTEGVIEYSGNTIIVKELPVWRSTNSYREFLTGLQKNKTISDWKETSKDPNFPEFVLSTKNILSIKELKLTRSFGATNHVLLDENNIPHNYRNTESIMEEFFQKRLVFYDRRRESLIKKLNEEIEVLEGKIKFIVLVINGFNGTEPYIIVANRKSSEVNEDMVKHGLNPELLTSTTLKHCTEDDIVKLTAKRDSKIREKIELENTASGIIWFQELTELEKLYFRHYSH
jgi:DNA topoisomerase II